MERIETVEELEKFVPVKTYEGRAFRRDLLAYYAAAQLYDVPGARSAPYLPRLKDVATFEEVQNDGGAISLYVGVVHNGRAGLIPIDRDVVKELCRLTDAEKQGAPF